MNRPLTYSELANLNDEYILEKLKQGKSTEQIKNEYAIENNLLDKMYGNKTGGKNKLISTHKKVNIMNKNKTIIERIVYIDNNKNKVIKFNKKYESLSSFKYNRKNKYYYI